MPSNDKLDVNLQKSMRHVPIKSVNLHSHVYDCCELLFLLFFLSSHPRIYPNFSYSSCVNPVWYTSNMIVLIFFVKSSRLVKGRAFVLLLTVFSCYIWNTRVLDVFQIYTVMQCLLLPVLLKCSRSSDFRTTGFRVPCSR